MAKKTISDFTDKEIKKRPKVELNEQWWKNAWPGDGRPAADGKMSESFKKHKTAKGGKSVHAITNSLKSLKNSSLAVEKNAKSSLLPDYPNRCETILKELKAFRLLADEEIKKARDLGKSCSKVYSKDFSAALKSKLRSTPEKWDITLAKIPVDVELLDVVIDELEEMKAANQLNIEYNKVFDATVNDCAKDVEKLLIDRWGRSNKRTAKYVSAKVDKHLASLSDSMFAVPGSVIKTIGLDSELDAIYQKELKKRKKHLLKTAGCTVVSGVAIALPGTQEFAIYGFVRSLAGAIQEITELCMGMSKKLEVLNTQVKYLHDVFLAAGKKDNVARFLSETGGTTINALLGVDIYPTLDKANSNMKDLQQHAGNASANSRKMMKEIDTLIDRNKLLKATADSLLESHKYYKSMTKKVKDSESRLNKILDKAHELTKALTKVQDQLPTLEKMLTEIGKNSKGQDLANNAAKVVVNLAGIAVGGLADASVAVNFTKTACESAQGTAALVIAAEGVIEELVGEAKEIAKLADT